MQEVRPTILLSRPLGDIFDQYKKRCRFLYDVIAYDKKYDSLNCYDYFKDILSYIEYRKCKNKDTSRYRKRSRCFSKYNTIDIIAKLTNSKMVFGTITLNDDYFRLEIENQKKVLQRYLKQHYFYVIKNKDYGGKTDRLHYHFIGLTFDKIISNGKKSKKGRPMYNIENDNWKYGFSPNLEIIEYNCQDKKILSNYLVKLNNHSNKISVKKSKLSILKNKKYLQKYCSFGDIIL